MTRRGRAGEPVTTAQAPQELATFEAVWLIRLRRRLPELTGALELIGLLCRDKATSRAIVHGDASARAEVVRAFRALLVQRQAFADDFTPAPARFEKLTALYTRAFDELAAAALEFGKSAGPVVDFDGLARVAGYLEKAVTIIDAVGPALSPPDA